LRVALFTPFSPEIGGGSAQLRSHLRYLSGLDLRWHYLSDQPAKHPQPQWNWLGPRLTPAELLSDLGARAGILPGSKGRVRKIAEQMDAEMYWVVGHYEGISVAADLCDQQKPVHLTIHDDPFGTWRRSNRFRMFQPLLSRTFPRLLGRARSVDTTSWGMRNLYRQKYDVKCFSVYLHVPRLPRLDCAPDPGKLTVGHIGTLYQKEPFGRFLNACERIAAEKKRALRVIEIGSSPEMNQFRKEHPAVFEAHGDLYEDDAVPLLARCDLLYAMYPSGSKYELFRRTSLPIKLSTYVQAQRPIFAHSPADSGLARIVGPARVGCVCSSEEPGQIARQIRETIEVLREPESFEALRRELMGLDQVRQLGAALRGQDWLSFPENNFRS
jgi:hypothetical protein